MCYVAMLTFDEETSSTLLHLRREISGLCATETAGAWIPHITLGIYGTESHLKLVSHAQTVASEFHQIRFQFQAYGSFPHSSLYPNTDVFCLFPSLPLNLTALYRRFHERNEEELTELGNDYQLFENGQPTLHSTLAICDTSSYINVSAYLYKNFKKMDAVITKIQIQNMEKDLIWEQSLLP